MPVCARAEDQRVDIVRCLRRYDHLEVTTWRMTPNSSEMPVAAEQSRARRAISSALRRHMNR